LKPPAGFEPLFRTSPLLDLIGPLFSRGKCADLVIGLRVQAKHCNARERSVFGGGAVRFGCRKLMRIRGGARFLLLHFEFHFAIHVIPACRT